MKEGKVRIIDFGKWKHIELLDEKYPPRIIAITTEELQDLKTCIERMEE